MRSVRELVDWLDRFARVHFVGFTCYWPILGLVASDVSIEGSAGAAVVAVGLSFHLFGFVLNDLADLPIDRTSSLRAADPLVAGSVPVGAAVGLVVASVPLAFLAARFAGADGATSAALALAFVLMAAYDLAGKRFGNPIVTDLALGLSGSALVLFGAGLAGVGFTDTAIVVAVYVACFFCLFNGIHGGMRDMQNDAAHGAHTTCLFLGMRFEGGTIRVSRSARLFCWSIQVALIAVVGWLMTTLEYDGSTALVVLSTSVGLAAVNLYLMHMLLTPEHPRWEDGYRLHLVTLVLAPAVPLVPLMGAAIATLVLLFLMVPLLLIERAPDVVRLVVPRRRVGS